MSIKAILFAVLFFLFGTLLMINQWGQLSRMPEQPVRIQLAELEKQYKNGTAYWVILEGGSWDCESIYHHDAGRSSRTRVIYQNGGQTAVYAEFSGLLSCEEISQRFAAGTVNMLENRSRTNSINENPALAKISNNTALFRLCTFCSPTNSKIGIIFGAVSQLVGLEIFYSAWKAFKSKNYYWELMRKTR